MPCIKPQCWALRGCCCCAVVCYKCALRGCCCCCFCVLRAPRRTIIMLPAVVKLCCGIAYPHLRTMTGLQRTAVVVIGQEISSRRRHHSAWGRIQLSSEWIQSCMGLLQPASHSTEARKEDPAAVPREDKDLFYVNQGQEALRRALDILSDGNGWKTEVVEDNGDVVRSKALPVGGAGGSNKKVFRLEGVVDASPEELYSALFLRVEDMHTWNPSIHHIKVLKHVGPETVVTHEVSAETAGNLIGQRDFLSVRHSCRHESCIYLGGAPTQLESFPLQKGFVRAEDGPTCIVIQPVAEDSGRSRITWLLNMDVKGWLPKSIVNQALPRAQLEFTRHLRRHLTTARASLGR